MKFTLALVAVGLCLSLNAFHVADAQVPWGAIAGEAMKRIGALFAEGSFDLLGHTCQYSVKPKISKLKLKYEGKTWCPGWTAINGRSTKNSKSGAIEHSVTEMVNKIREKGLVSDADAQKYLEQYNKG